MSAALSDGLWRTALGPLSPGGTAGRLSIVLFHRVLPAPDPMFPEDMHRARFDALCGWLARWYRVLPLDEAVRRLAEGTLPARALCITFDDGYADNHDVALPILQAHGLCATFFIATSFLDGGRMWNDSIVEAVRRSTLPHLSLRGLGLELPDEIELPPGAGRAAVAGRLLMAVKYLAHDRRVEVAEAIGQRSGASLPGDLMMSTAQLRAMAAAGMQIGAHTLSHPILKGLDDRRAGDEIVGSRDRLQALLGRPVELFAYPNGKPGQDYGPRDVALVREAGFRAAVSTAYGAARGGAARFHELPRFTPWDHERVRFGLRLARNLFVAPQYA